MPERIPNGLTKRVVFRAIDSADHFTPKTAATIAVTISKNGGAFANPAAGATNATEISSGFYYFDLGSGDTGTGGPLAWRGAAAAIDDVGDVYEVVNATNAGFTALPNVASGAPGALITSGTGTAQLSVASGLVTLASVTHTGAVIPTVTTLTGHTAQTGDSFARLTGVGAVTLASLKIDGTTEFIGLVSADNGLEINGGTQTDAVRLSGASNGSGLVAAGNGSGEGIRAVGGATGHGMEVVGGSATGDGLRATVTSGAEINADISGTLTTVTTLTNLPAITSNWLTSAGIAASALNGKGDWPVGKTGYSLTATTGLGNQTANITGTITTVTNLTNLPATAALEATLTDMKGATFSGATDSLEALRNRGDAAWTTATGFATPTNITAATGITLAPTTGFGTQTGTLSTVTTTTTATNLTNAPTVGDLTATMKASVNAEMLDVLNTDTFAEPGQGAPAATATLATKINYLYKAWRNRKTQTASQYSLFADDATTVDQKATVSDNGTTTEVGEIATGP